MPNVVGNMYGFTNKGKNLNKDIQDAVKHFKKKIGVRPTTVWVKPSIFKIIKGDRLHLEVEARQVVQEGTFSLWAITYKRKPVKFNGKRTPVK
jgi:hypothetical protein